MPSDTDLRALTDGNTEAWNRFVEKYSGAILSTATHTLRAYTGSSSPSDAEEIGQDVFLRLLKDDFRILKLFDPTRASIATWLTAIARNAAIDWLRARKPSIPIEEAHAIPGPSLAPSAPLRFPPDLLTARQELVLTLFFEKNLEVPEVAQFLGIEEQSVRSIKNKALQSLREHVERCGPI